jgi:hypothetical protein
MKLLWLVELWSNVTGIRAAIGNCLSAVCQIVFGLKQKDASWLFVFNCALVYAIKEAPAKLGVLEFNVIKWDVMVTFS